MGRKKRKKRKGKKEKEKTKMAGEGSGSGGNRRFLTAVRRLIIKAQRKGKDDSTGKEELDRSAALAEEIRRGPRGRRSQQLEAGMASPVSQNSSPNTGRRKEERQSLDLVEVGDLWTRWPHLAHLSTEGIGILLNATSACWCKPGKRLITSVYPVMPVDSFQGAPMA